MLTAVVLDLIDDSDLHWTEALDAVVKREEKERERERGGEREGREKRERERERERREREGEIYHVYTYMIHACLESERWSCMGTFDKTFAQMFFGRHGMR